jgi:hypothetical protein
MITITNATSAVSIEVYDQKSIIERYEALGISDPEMDKWNSYTYGIFPDGSSGKFVVAADKVSVINTGKFEITLTIFNNETYYAITFQNLLVKSVSYFEVPVTSWALANPATDAEESRKVAIVELVDYSANMGDILDKDYNQITRLAPKDTANKFEPIVGSLLTFPQIISDILTNHPVGTTTLTLSHSGFPASFKPRNVLIAGSALKDVLRTIADAHYMVVFIDKNGVLTMTNAQTSSELVPAKDQLIYSSYGPPACPTKVDVVFSENGHQQSKQRTTLLIDYLGNTDTPWAQDQVSPSATTDPTLPNVARTPSSGNAEAIYYPFFENDTYGTPNSNSEYMNLIAALKTNYEARTLRMVKLVYKDIVLIEPSATISKVRYVYSPQGMLTSTYSSPPEGLAVPPLVNQISRGLEYVPPFLRGTVTIGGTAPTTENSSVQCELKLPLLGHTAFKVPFFNESKDDVAVGDMVGVHFNIHTRRYELISGGGGGGSDEIRFIIKKLDCTGTTPCVWVQWTHYTGSCGAIPPGIDPYTGYIKVIDSCVLSYYTQDFLTGGATGRATYWHTNAAYGASCSGVWIIDAICGQPECA